MTLPYLEMGAPCAREAQTFFNQLFGWRFHPMDNGGWFESGDIVTGLHGGDAQPAIVVYFEVTNIDHAVAKVRELGGDAQDPTPDEPGFGRFSDCKDPQGIRFGLRQR